MEKKEQINEEQIWAQDALDETAAEPVMPSAQESEDQAAAELQEPCEDEALPEAEECNLELEPQADSETKKAEPKKGIFSKKADKKDQKIEELTDRLTRSMAEFDNYRKRTEKEKTAMYAIGAKDMIERILPVVDNFERGLASIPEDAQGLAFAEGMEMIYKQLLKALEEAGVTPIEALGQPFDPELHNAVMHVEDDTVGENVIVQELQKGYLYRDSVVRYSMVQVAN